MPAAQLGGENPLTPLRGYATASNAGAPDAAGRDVDYPDRGREGSILPYRLQDQYDRRRSPRVFKAIVLENRHLKATFLPEVGGRLWSLVHRSSGRELLFVNPVFQPANLAVRDAWFSGGVEWNVSIIGHSAFTCAPVFAARVVADDGTSALRLYEWDRVRCVPFQIDFWLPDEVPFLMARVRITNPNDRTIPMYWWSNIAVPEREDVRVLGPATQAYRHDYDGTLVGHDVPMYGGVDVTYTTNRRGAADLYFRIPPENRPWIASLDGEGRGLVHTSTDRLIGRKMFNWGMDPGGRRWQEFLAEPGQAYIEIQGGLAQTQGEYVPMPAGAEWSWLEAYGLIEADASRVHGADWSAAYRCVEEVLERRLPRKWVEEEFERSAAAIADRRPVEMLHEGAGWGALERIRRERAGEKPFASSALPFRDTTIGDEQRPWIALLETGKLPFRAVSSGPGSLMIQPQWRELLERSVRAGGGENWLSWYHLGVMRYRAGERDPAREALRRSLDHEASPWAYRDLAVMADEDRDVAAAADLWRKASRLAPNLAPLAIETVKAILKSGEHDSLARYVESLPPAVRAHGRIRLLRAMAALAQGNLAEVGAYFEGDLDIANIREKETILSDLWFGWHEQRIARERGVPVDDEICQLVRREFPPPQRFDFRLKAD